MPGCVGFNTGKRTAVLYCGDNNDGQAGIASGDPFLPHFTEVCGDGDELVACALSKSQLFLVLKSRSVISAGQNDNGELGREGKLTLAFP